MTRSMRFMPVAQEVPQPEPTTEVEPVEPEVPHPVIRPVVAAVPVVTQGMVVPEEVH
ncbi:MAG: hypothetical protein WCR20_03065 [Verrucomicrobiota bacterium]